jgi:hypothetical protein
VPGDKNCTYEIEPSHKDSSQCVFPLPWQTKVGMSQLRRSVNIFNPVIRTALVPGCRSITVKNATAGCNRTWLQTRSLITTRINLQQSRESSKEEQTLIYSAPNAPTVKLLKMFSVTSLGVKVHSSRTEAGYSIGLTISSRSLQYQHQQYFTSGKRQPVSIRFTVSLNVYTPLTQSSLRSSSR